MRRLEAEPKRIAGIEGLKFVRPQKEVSKFLYTKASSLKSKPG